MKKQRVSNTVAVDGVGGRRNPDIVIESGGGSLLEGLSRLVVDEESGRRVDAELSRLVQAFSSRRAK